MTVREVRELAAKKAAKKERINSRQKGSRGEREFAALLRSHGLAAYRGQQFRGGGDSPDVVCPDLPHVHFEVKFVQQVALYEWIAQAVRDAKPDAIRAVVHRRKGKTWLMILPIEDALRLILGTTTLPKAEKTSAATAIHQKD
jgi:Holliday junction resolvase